MEIHKSKLDNLFKKGLADESEEYKEEHWLALEHKLNEEREKPFILLNRKWISVAAALLIFAGAGIWLNKSEKQAKTLHIKNLSKSKNSKSVEIDDVFEKGRLIPKKQNEHIERKEITIEETTEPSLVRLKTLATKRGNTGVAANRKKMVRDTAGIVSSSASTVNEANVPQVQTAEIYDGRSNVNSENTAKEIQTIAATNDSAESPQLTAETSGLTLAVVAAPDLTSVRGSGRLTTSQNVGLLVSKNISNKLTVSAGVVHSWKNYSSPYRFYNPEHKMEMQEYPTDVDAKCRILNIPLSVHYSIAKSPAHQIRVGVGTSSYIMLNERYQFKYQANSTRSYEVTGENSHLFGTVDLSISYERRLKFLTLGIQPFYQVPLKGIGYGRTNLQSKGIALSLGINLGKR